MNDGTYGAERRNVCVNVEEAIRTRRSIGKVKADPVPRALIERIIESAAWAPNHHRTEPWKFFVATGEGRLKLGKAYAEIAAEELEGVAEEERDRLLARQTAKALRAPVVIAVACSPADAPRVMRIEEFAAVHAAVQNMLLTAHALGLGAIWRTGDPVYHPAMKRALGLLAEDEIAGLIYVGYPDMAPPPAERSSANAKTVWLTE